MDILNKLIGKTFVGVVQQNDDCVTFFTDSVSGFKMLHLQDCCEDVYLDDVCGDLRDLVGSEILKAYATSSQTENQAYQALLNYVDLETALINKLSSPVKIISTGESETWTFYHISTIKGSVTFRWYGTSNGYYSERVDLIEFNKST